MNNQSEQWHMKKEVNLAHVITTVGALVTGMWYLSDLDKRIQSSEQAIEYIQKQRAEDQRRIEKQLDKINIKLDKILAKK